MPEKWEPLLNNLGHTMRKMKRYEQALEFHRQAMVLSPQNSTTYVAIGFVYSLMFKWHEAIENFHKALGLKREDTFTNSMINLAMDHLINSSHHSLIRHHLMGRLISSGGTSHMQLY